MITDLGNFELLLDELFVLTSRPSSIQRELFFGKHLGSNPFFNVRVFLTISISDTDVDWILHKQDFDVYLKNLAKPWLKHGFLHQHKEEERKVFKKWIETARRLGEVPEKINSMPWDEVVQRIRDFYDYPGRDDSYFIYAMIMGIR